MNEEIKSELEKKLSHYNEQYKSGTREISDEEYDALLEELRKIDPENPLCTEIQEDFAAQGSGTVNYGNEPMLSIQKFYDAAKLVEWIRNNAESPDHTVLLEPKYDGMSGQYADGVLSTRGDGHTGQNISKKLKLFDVIEWFCDCESNEVMCSHGFNESDFLRGELIISQPDFEKVRKNLRKKDGTEYTNCRNFIAGVCNCFTSEEDDERVYKALSELGVRLSFVPHDSYYLCFRAGNISEADITSTFEFFKSKVPFDQDGIVIKFTGEKFREKMGRTSHHEKWAAAFKINLDGVWTKITDIEWTLSGTDGSLTPTAKVEPIQVDDGNGNFVTVSSVLLHNFKNVIDNDIDIGHTEVCVLRSGGVIPFATNFRNSREDETDIGLEENCDGEVLCPECHKALSYKGGDVDIYCKNEQCHGFLKKRLYNASSKCFEILGLAESTIAKIYEKFGVARFFQLLDLEAEQLASLPGFAKNSGEKLWASIQKTRVTSDVKVLASLGIPLIGRHVAKDLLSMMPLSDLRNATTESLIAIGGCGPEKAKSLISGLLKYTNELDELLSRVEMKQTFVSGDQNAPSEAGHERDKGTPGVVSMDAPTICFTGEAPYPRSKCQEIARNNGYEPVSGVNKSLSVLVCANADTNSTKAQKARKNGTKILGFDDWFSSLKNREFDSFEQANHGNSAVDSILNSL